MKKTFLLHEPKFNYAELKYLSRSIRSGWISPSGEYVKKFENKLSLFTKSKCILANSGTSALHLSLILSDVKKNDEVLVPSITFIATINSVMYMAATPVFLDCGSETLNVDLNKVVNFLDNQTFTNSKGTFNKKSKNKISAIIITHVFGNLLNLNYFYNICKKKKIKVIEDAAEALGTFNEYNKHAGTTGDYGVLSFNANKVITSASGGALFVKKNTDFLKAKKLIAQSKVNPVFFTHDDMGFNYGMSNIHAAIGLGQFEKIKKILKKKEKIFLQYKKNFIGEKKFEFGTFNKNSKPNYWLNYIILKKNFRYNYLKSIINNLIKEGIQVRPLWYPCHKQNHLKFFKSVNIKNANHIYKQVVCLPSSHFLKMNEINYISKIVKSVINFNS